MALPDIYGLITLQIDCDNEIMIKEIIFYRNENKNNKHKECKNIIFVKHNKEIKRRQ